MKRELLTRCGFRCDLCLAYKENVEKEDRRTELSDGWEKCFGFRIPTDEIYCEGCMTAGSPTLIDTGCPVRPCVIERGLNNCSECDEYPCEKFKQREVIYEEIIKDRNDITELDRTLFIKPYENKVRLDNLKNKKASSSESSSM